MNATQNVRTALWLLVFHWKIERFADAEAMSPAMIWRVYTEHTAYDQWVAELSPKK